MIIDIFVLITILLSALIAFLRGFIREVLTIFGVFGGLAAAYFLGPYLLPLVDGWLDVDRDAETPRKLFDIVPVTYLSQLLTYGGVFIVVVIILSLLSHFIAESVKNIGLGAIDRTLGVMFGIVRGVLLIGILYLPVYISTKGTEHEEKVETWFEGSKSFVYIEMTSEAIAGFVPEDTVESLKKEQMAKVDGADGQVRGTLEKLELLNKKNKDGDLQNAPEQDEKGYNDKQREEMNKLFDTLDEHYGEEER